MKKWWIGLCLALLPGLAMAQNVLPLSIGAASVGYGATSTDRGEFFTNYWGGLRTLNVSPYTAVYTCYQHLGQNGGWAGDGVKVMLVSGSEKFKALKLVSDLGVAWNLAANEDSTKAAAFTVGGGIEIGRASCRERV